MNKKISTPIALGIILFLSIVLVIFIVSQSTIITPPLIEINKNKCTQDAGLNYRRVGGQDPCNRVCNSDEDCKEECGCGCISKEEKCIYTGVLCEAPDPDYGCKCIDNICSYKYIGTDETADLETYFPSQPTQQEREDAKKIPKDQCPCWDGVNNICLPQVDCI